EVARAALGLERSLLLHLADAAREVVAHLLLRVDEDLLPRLADRQPRDPLQLSALRVARLFQLLLELFQVHLAVGDALLAARELRQLAVDLVLFLEDALLD